MAWYLDLLSLIVAILLLVAGFDAIAILRRRRKWRRTGHERMEAFLERTFGHGGLPKGEPVPDELVKAYQKPPQRVPHFAAMQEAGADGPADRTFHRIDHGRQVITSDGIRIDGEGLRAAWGYHPIDHPTVHYFDRMNGADGEHWVSKCGDVISRTDANKVRWRQWTEGSPRCSRCYAAVYPGQVPPPQLTN